MPIGFNNVRNGVNTMSFIANGTQYSIILSDKNYTTIQSLLTDLNTLLNVVFPSLTVSVISSSAFLNRLQIYAANLTSFSIIDTNFSLYVLGFRKSYDTFSNNYYTSKFSGYNLNADNYVTMSIPNIGSNTFMGGQIGNFKIPLNTVQSNIYFYFDSQSFSQWIDILDKNFILKDLIVIMYDKFGNILQNNGYDFSFTLQIDQYVD
jgi:hypothetical protein